MVHCDHLKPFRRKPPTMNVPTRDKTPETAASTSKVPTRNGTPSYSTPPDDINHTYCTKWPTLPAPQYFLHAIATRSSGSNLPIPCPTPATGTFLMGTVTVQHIPASTLPYTQNSEQTN